MTPTEKKYSDNVGKLYIVRSRQYNSEKEKFEYHHSLIMVYGIRKSGWNGKSGYYLYNVNTISSVDVEWKKDYAIRCKDLDRGTGNGYWYSTDFLPLTDDNKHLIDTIVECAEQ